MSLKRCDDIKDLGIVFDSSMSFIPHISQIISSANRMLGFVIRNRRDFVNTDVLKILYFSYVRSKLESCSLVWYPIYATHILSIERVQKRFLKMLSLKSSGVYPDRGTEYSILLNTHSFVSLNTRRILNSLGFLHDLLHNNIICEYLLSKISFHVPLRSSRHSLTFYCDVSRTNVMRKSPVTVMCTNFNSLSDICDINLSTKNQLFERLLAHTHNL
nr:unnamed protein product [Callosobruchus chinensis]